MRHTLCTLITHLRKCDTACCQVKTRGPQGSIQMIISDKWLSDQQWRLRADMIKMNGCHHNLSQGEAGCEALFVDRRW
jgi:hypothetical protein